MSTDETADAPRDDVRTRTSDQDDDRPRGRQRVRPRWSWGGLALLVVGAVVAGVGIATLTWVVVLVGAVLLALGAGAAVHGGLLFDVFGNHTAKAVVHDVAEGGSRPAPGPGETIRSPEALDDAEGTAAIHRAIMEHQEEYVRPGARPIGVLLVALVTLWLVASQGGVYPDEGSGRGDSLVGLGVAILMGGCALALGLRGGSRVVSGLVGLGGVALVLHGALVAGTGHATASHVVCGIVLLLATPLTLGRGGGGPRVGDDPALPG